MSDIIYGINRDAYQKNSELGETIAANFAYYLKHSSEYQINVVTDAGVEGINYGENIPNNLVDLIYCFRSKFHCCPDGIEKYKLVTAFLLQADKFVLDKFVSGSKENLLYVFTDTPVQENKKLLMVYGRKVWIDNPLIPGKTPFKNMRGIILSRREFDNAQKSCERFSNIPLFVGYDRNKYLPVQVVYGRDCKQLTPCEGCKDCLHCPHKNSCRIKRLELCSEKKSAYSMNNTILKAYPPQEYMNLLVNSVNTDTRLLDKGARVSPSMVVYPELSVLREKLSSVPDYSKLSKKPCVTIIGASDLSSTSYNQALVFDSDGKLQGEYYKKTPFSLMQADKQVISEDLEVNSDLFFVCAQDCITGIAICSDVVNFSNDLNPIHRYADFVDVLVIISESSADTEMFLATAENLARWYNCAVIYANDINIDFLENANNTNDKLVEVSFCISPQKDSSVLSPTALKGDVLYKKNLPITTKHIKPHFMDSLGSDTDTFITLNRELKASVEYVIEK